MLAAAWLDRLALLLLCLLAFTWRVSGLTAQSLWRDEVDSIRFATRSLPDLLRTFTKPGENGPLFFLALRPWLALAGQSEFALRLPSALAGTLAVPLTYVLTRQLLRLPDHLTGRGTAGLSLSNVPLIAALFVAVNPYLVWYSQEGRMYALLVVLVLAVHIAWLAALVHGEWWRWLAYLVLLALAALTHVLAVLVIPLHAVWLVLLGRRYRRRWLPFLATLVLPALPYFALVGWWQARLFLDSDFQTGHPFVPLSDMANVLLVGLSHGIATSAQSWILTLVIFLLLVGALMGWRRYPGRARQTAMLAMWLLLPPLLLFAISLSKPLFTDRYLVWIAPAFAILLALGAEALGHVWRWLGWLALAFVVVLGLATGWRQTHTPVKSDFRAAAAYVAEHRQPGERLLFQIPYGRYTFEYYAGPDEDWADGPYTNNDNPVAQVAEEMQQAVGDAPAVWLIASEEALWDRRGLTRAWLEEHGRPTNDAQFARVRVTRYELRQPD